MWGGIPPCSPESDRNFGIYLDFICDTFVADFGMLYTGVQGMWGNLVNNLVNYFSF